MQRGVGPGIVVASKHLGAECRECQRQEKPQTPRIATTVTSSLREPALKSVHGIDDGLHQRGRRVELVGADGGDQAIFPEVFAPIHAGFGDAIGIHHQGVAGEQFGSDSVQLHSRKAPSMVAVGSSRSTSPEGRSSSGATWPQLT